jgi:hypothetical protein
VTLNGLVFATDLRQRHKTGLYLDQQVNYQETFSLSIAPHPEPLATPPDTPKPRCTSTRRASLPFPFMFVVTSRPPSTVSRPPSSALPPLLTLRSPDPSGSSDP